MALAADVRCAQEALRPSTGTFSRKGRHGRMVQTRHTRWPTFSEALTYLPGGTPAIPLGLPAGARMAGWDLQRGFPVLRVDPDVVPGTTYVFLFGDLVADSAVPEGLQDEWVTRALRLVGSLLRRILVTLNLPLAWTAPQPDPTPNYVPGGRMSTPIPPPRLPITGGVRVVHKGTMSGQQVVMTHGVKLGAAPTGPQLDALVAVCRDAFQANLRDRLVTAYTYQSCQAYDLSPNSAAAAEIAGTGTGVETGAPASLSVAAIVAWKTARAGRSFRGRTFYAPLSSAYLALDGRTITPAGLTAFQSAWTAYRTAVDAATTTGGGKIAVLSERLGSAEEVTSLVVRQVVGSQRGRLR